MIHLFGRNNSFSLRRYSRKQWQSLKSSIYQLRSSLLSTIFTCIVIGMVLALPISIYIMLQNIQITENNLRSSYRINLYLARSIQTMQLENLMKLLKNDRDVQTVRYISPDEGLRSMEQQFQIKDFLNGLKENPLPGVIVVQPSDRLQSKLTLNQFIERIRQRPFVEEVQSDILWLQRLNKIIEFAHRIIQIFALFFAMTVLLVIGNTIRLMVQNRKEEIVVMKLLGAQDYFVRLPFLYSGVICGLMGSLISVFFVNGMIEYLQNPLGNLMHLYGSTFELKGIDSRSILLLMLSGMFLGYLGSRLAVNAHIKSIEPE